MNSLDTFNQEQTTTDQQLATCPEIGDAIESFAKYAQLAMTQSEDLEPTVLDAVEQIRMENRTVTMEPLQPLFVEICESMPLEPENYDFISFALEQLQLQNVELSQGAIDRFTKNGHKFFVGTYDPNLVRI